MPNFVRTRWTVVLAIAIFLGVAGIVLESNFRQTDGHLIYAVDDAYIHMAMAKNLAGHGVYGVTADEFSSSSSSPLWTILLACAFKIFGVHDAIPFIVNLVLACLILIVAYRFLLQSGLKSWAIFSSLLAVMFLTPMWAVVFSGMEHALHILLVVVFIQYLKPIIQAEDPHIPGAQYWKGILLTAALVLARYESYALVGLAVVFLAVRRRRLLAGALVLSAVVPLVMYQAISVAHGWFWLPNSIFIRAGGNFVPGMTSSTPTNPLPSIVHSLEYVLQIFWKNITDGPHLACLVLSAILVLAMLLMRGRSFWKSACSLLSLYILMAVAHLVFGRIGYFFRYEAYLVASGSILLASSLFELRTVSNRAEATRAQRNLSAFMIVLCILLPAFPLGARSRNAFSTTPIASRNIYEQQYQMGTFLRQNYPGAAVAVNDIGAVSYLGNIHLVDLVGLGSIDILRLQRGGIYTTESIGKICEGHGVSVALLYDSWFERGNMHGVPSSWIRAGQWKILDNVICGDDIVSIYAVQPSKLGELVQNLRRFSSALPARVVQSGMYLSENTAGPAR